MNGCRLLSPTLMALSRSDCRRPRLAPSADWGGSRQLHLHFQRLCHEGCVLYIRIVGAVPKGAILKLYSRFSVVQDSPHPSKSSTWSNQFPSRSRHGSTGIHHHTIPTHTKNGRSSAESSCRRTTHHTQCNGRTMAPCRSRSTVSNPAPRISSIYGLLSDLQVNGAKPAC